MDKYNAATIIQGHFSEFYDPTVKYDNGQQFYKRINDKVQHEVYTSIKNNCEWIMLCDFDPQSDWEKYCPTLSIDGAFNTVEEFANYREGKLSFGTWAYSAKHEYTKLVAIEFRIKLLPSWLMWALNTKKSLVTRTMAWRALTRVVTMLFMEKETTSDKYSYVHDISVPVFGCLTVENWTDSEYLHNYVNCEGNAFSALYFLYHNE